MANIIKQLKDSNGNNIYPIAYAQGGVKIDLLWTNPSPTVNFTSQTISLTLTDYDYLLVECTWATSFAGDLSYHICKNGVKSSLFCSNPTNTGVIGIRQATVSTSGVTISDAKNGTTTANNIMIPTCIYGIKMSYIVPTTVNGLQYVEV